MFSVWLKHIRRCVSGFLLVAMPLSLTAAEPVGSMPQLPTISNQSTQQPMQQPVIQPTQGTEQQPTFGEQAAGGATPWFTVFNVTNKRVPGSFYAYSIEGNTTSCGSPCTQLVLPEDSDGASVIPSGCRVAGCSSFSLFLQGKSAGPSCTNINVTNLAEVWVHVDDNQFAAKCQPFYNTVQSGV